MSRSSPAYISPPIAFLSHFMTVPSCGKSTGRDRCMTYKALKLGQIERLTGQKMGGGRISSNGRSSNSERTGSNGRISSSERISNSERPGSNGRNHRNGRKVEGQPEPARYIAGERPSDSPTPARKPRKNRSFRGKNTRGGPFRTGSSNRPNNSNNRSSQPQAASGRRSS